MIERVARSRLARRAAMLAFPAAVLLLVGAALSPGGATHRSSGHAGVLTLASRAVAPNPLGVRVSKVYGSSIPASVYGTQIADLEDQGVNTRGEMVSDLSPLPARAFVKPVASYKVYAERWTTVAQRDANRLAQALARGSRTGAQSAWRATWSAYLHLGAVYGLFGTLNEAIDGVPGGLPRGSGDPRFTGLHRIEMGLWTGARARSLEPFAVRLTRDLAHLRRVLPSVQISPLEYATRAHEILEDAQRDLLSGVSVPWSGEGVLGTAAGLAATQEVFHTLEPLLQGRDNTEAVVRSELLLLSAAIERIRRDHRGWPTLAQLTMRERELIDGTLAGALGALELLPGTLETEAPSPIPKLPGRAAAGTP
ncbi:MAG TPA: EfeM/EfeO family lipoprotein [Solirubrobacteraceae bacterium]|nr:EfeM/EfeO family lipoprotein [Solirubrobacteraceae bacterium]